jgi:NDP-sugar pyrophosphorylase family protein
VLSAPDGRVLAVEVKQPRPRSRWVWGAFKMPGAVLAELFLLWCERDQRDEYLGTLLNAYIAGGGEVRGVPAGRGYVDIGTLDGYRQALQLLGAARRGSEPADPLAVEAGAAGALR